MHKILIVDDESHIRRLLRQSLEDVEEAGCEIIEAENGLNALLMIKKYRPGLVLLDVMMPVMNGFEVCSAIKKEMKADEVYVIMLTAKGQEIDRKKGIECGADEYITKPFDPEVIAEKAFEILKITK